MRRALIVDCCLRGAASRTRRLMDAFAKALPADVAAETLVLEEEALSCLAGAHFEQRQRLLEEGRLDHPRFRYARQFAGADIVCVAAPFWDLMFPALLKVYIEQVSVEGITFATGENQLVGLCRGTDLVLLTTRGGFYTGDPMEMGSRYLDALHTFFGFDRYACVAADGLDIDPANAERILAKAEREARALAAGL